MFQRRFDMTRSIEGALTRPVALGHPREIIAAFVGAEFALESAVPTSFLPRVPYRVTGSARVGRARRWPARTSVLAGVLGLPVIVRTDRRRA